MLFCHILISFLRCKSTEQNTGFASQHSLFTLFESTLFYLVITFSVGQSVSFGKKCLKGFVILIIMFRKMFGHTVVDMRIVLFKVDYGRKLFDAVHLDELFVISHHHPDSNSVSIIINVFQMLQSLFTELAIGSIWKR